jgi:hypothetical protein
MCCKGAERRAVYITQIAVCNCGSTFGRECKQKSGFPAIYSFLIMIFLLLRHLKFVGSQPDRGGHLMEAALQPHCLSTISPLASLLSSRLDLSSSYVAFRDDSAASKISPDEVVIIRRDGP